MISSMFKNLLSRAALVTILLVTMADTHAGTKVRLETSKGTVVLELADEMAPISVENFLSYVENGFYDGTLFHRVIPGFMVQGGGFGTGMARKKTQKPIRNEADNGLSNDRGTVAMARTASPHSATAQFYINLVDNLSLNHTSKSAAGWGYAVIGKVIEGMEVVDVLAAVPTGRGDLPHEEVTILTAAVVE